MSTAGLSAFLDLTLDGIQIWVVLLLCVFIFLASLMDAIAGGGGIISVPAYLVAFGNLPVPFALGTNKFSAAAGTAFSTRRFIKDGYVNWELFAPAAVLSLVGSLGGTWLQHRTPDLVLKYLLLAVLPVVALLTLRTRNWPDSPGEMAPARRRAVIWAASLLIGAYDGYYGPGTGTFLMLVFVRLAKLDTRHAAGGVKVINLASNLGGVCAQLVSGYVLLGVGLCTAAASIAGHLLGSGLAIRHGSRIVRPVVILVLTMLTVKVLSEVAFPQLWK